MNNSPATRNRRILVVDDNASIHADFKKILHPEPADNQRLTAIEAEFFGRSLESYKPRIFEVDSAFQSEEALALVKQATADDRPYAVAFVDVHMPPGMDGIETAARIWELDPRLQIVICTAYSDYSWNDMMSKLGTSDRLVILKKPFDNVEVMQLAHTLTEKWTLEREVRAKMSQLEDKVAERTRELLAANEQLHAEIAERARTEEALRQSQKMDALGQLAGGMAHDFNNLLTVIRGNAQCLLMDEQPPLVAEGLQEIDDAADRAAKLTAQILMFSRKKIMQQQHLDLQPVLAKFGKMLPRLLGENISVEIESTPEMPTVYADPVMIEQVILNLAVNARDAMPQGGKLRIRLHRMEFRPEDLRRHLQARAGHFICMAVTDTGCGIASQALPHLFEPFFTTKEQGKGTGLGLATAYGIVKQHEGWIEVESQPGQGATFKVFLPTSVKPQESAKSAPTPVAVRGGTETILLVEDEQSLRLLARRVLQRKGYQVLEAGSGVEALLVWDRHASEIDLLLTDMIMPDGLSGRQLAEKLLAKNSDLRVVFATGYSPDVFERPGSLEEGFNFLPKPYSPRQLVQTVRRCLDEPTPNPTRP